MFWTIGRALYSEGAQCSWFCGRTERLKCFVSIFSKCLMSPSVEQEGWWALPGTLSFFRNPILKVLLMENMNLTTWHNFEFAVFAIWNLLYLHLMSWFWRYCEQSHKHDKSLLSWIWMWFVGFEQCQVLVWFLSSVCLWCTLRPQGSGPELIPRARAALLKPLPIAA